MITSPPINVFGNAFGSILLAAARLEYVVLGAYFCAVAALLTVVLRFGRGRANEVFQATTRMEKFQQVFGHKVSFLGALMVLVGWFGLVGAASDRLARIGTAILLAGGCLVFALTVYRSIVIHWQAGQTAIGRKTY